MGNYYISDILKVHFVKGGRTVDKNDSKKKEHNLEDASKTLGQVYNVNSYDDNYKEKKGMKVLGYIIIAVVIISAIILIVTK